MSSPVITPDILQRLRSVQSTGPAPLIPANPFAGGGMGLAAMPAMGTPAMPNVSPSQTMTDQGELNRLKATGSGVSQIQNPILHGLAKFGDVAASIVAPRIAAALPGTTLHHQQLMGQEQGVIGNDLATEAQTAQTANLNLQPQLTLARQGLAQEKQDALESHQQDALGQQKAIAQQKYVQNLRDHGFAPDEADATGKAVRPLAYNEMSETQQAVHDLKAAQEEQAQAAAALNKAKNDPSSAAYKQAQARINVARQNASTASGKLGLQTQQFVMRSRGTDMAGNALPGAMIGDDGTPVGTAFQGNVRPTGSERNKADMANSAAEQLSDIKDIVAKHPDMFGPGYGQASAFKQWIGSQDPDAQRFVAARTIAGDHLAGTFGGRSEAALTAIDNAIGQYKDNPAAMQAGLNQLTKANTSFQRAGTVRAEGSTAVSSPQAFSDGGITYHIPAEHVAEFKKDHPNAR